MSGISCIARFCKGVDNMGVTISNRKLFYAYLSGAKEVMNHKNALNSINVFPVADGDTGNNLFSMMNNIVQEAIYQPEFDDNFEDAFETIANAALMGARGNSGIIFAQYLNGISVNMAGAGVLSMDRFIGAHHTGVDYAYKAIENPVEGTMITVMRVFDEALKKYKDHTKDFVELLEHAYRDLEKALKETTNQLQVLKKASVVDSGAKGFTLFVQGFIHFLKGDLEEFIFSGEEELLDISEAAEAAHVHEEIKFRYCTEALIQGDNLEAQYIREILHGLGDSLIVAVNRKKARIHLHTDRPYEVMERLQSFSKILFQKADDMVRQNEVLSSRRSKIALVTDSIADLPQEMMDAFQVHMIPIHLLVEETNYLDKLTIRNGQALEFSKHSHTFPTTSQPDVKSVENLFATLKQHYESIIAVTVSKTLSGTYNVVQQAAAKFTESGYPITVIDSKQNSGAEGLLVMKCAQDIMAGKTYVEIVERVQAIVPNSKILVKIKNIDNMIRSGRLSIRMGKVAKWVNLKPVITLDQNGKGSIERVAFSDQGATNKTIAHVRKVMKSKNITEYAIVHINDLKEALQYAALFEKIIGKKPAYITETSSVIAVGAGQSAVAIAYLTETE